MDNDVIQKKLDSLIKCVNRIESQKIETEQDLQSDLDKQEIIILNLERAVQICVDIGNHLLLDLKSQTPSTMAETFKLLYQNKMITKQNAENLAHSVGFRKIAVHQYQDIDNSIVFAIIKNHIDDFRQFAKAIYSL